MRISIRCLSLAVALAAGPASAMDVAGLRDLIRRAMTETGVRGASVALIRGGETVWLEGYGVRDQRSGEPVTPSTVFQAASLGKPVAAYGALLRVAEGAWQLDMPLSSPRLASAPGCRPPTLVEALSHTAGLGNALLAETYAAGCPLPAPFAYAGQGYLLLQQLFGPGNGGRAAEAFFQQNVFKPLGMASTTYARPHDDDVATGHADLLYGTLAGRTLGAARFVAPSLALLVLGGGFWWVQRAVGRGRRARTAAAMAIYGLTATAGLAIAAALVVVPTAPWDDEIRLPSSLHTNAEDMARFAGEMLEPNLIHADTRDLLLEPQARIDARLGWSAGLGIDTVPTAGGPTPTYWQWGSNPGFQGLFILVPSRGDALVVLTNTGGFADVVLDDRGGYVLARRLARQALDLPEGRWQLSR